MTDLHQRLAAAVEARRQLAQAARHEVWDVLPQWLPAAAGQHLAANSPAQILRDTEAHLKLLADHQPLRVTYWPTVMCGRCSSLTAASVPDPLGSESPWTPNEDWPCPTIDALAGIYPEETGT